MSIIPAPQSRLVFPPPAASQTPDMDRFGLPKRLSLLESEETTTDRKERVVKLVEDVFAAAASHLGEESARLLFRAVASRRRGKPRGSTSAERDLHLLETHDAMANSGHAPRNIATRVAEAAKAERPELYHTEISAIVRQLRRILAERRKARAAYEAEFQDWREAFKASFGHYPQPTLLSETGTYPDK